MSQDFSNITILGGGLLGGSLALALPNTASPPNVRLWARRKETAEHALSLGISQVTTDLCAALEGADLVILAIPVGSMATLVGAALECGIPSNCLITDVGSVKRFPHLAITPLLAERGNRFIGSHPMAGSERNGLAAVSADLFQGAACLLTNDDRAPADLALALERFWKSVGCRTTWMSAAVHDELVARISHLPHILAASCARVCLKYPSEGRFGGGGLKDTTRVAGGNPTMWAEILIENREALVGPIRETLADLREILASLESADQEQARQWLFTGKKLRDHLKSLG